MGDFLNGFVQDPQNFWTAIASVVVALAIFGWRYNKWMDDLGEDKDGYTALLVALGVVVTQLGVAVISWRAAVLGVALYFADGLFMIFGDIRRSLTKRKKDAKKKAPRRKPLPYAAAGLIDDALIALSEAQREMKALLGVCFGENYGRENV